MMKRALTVITLSLVLMLSLASCGKRDSDSAHTPNISPAPSASQNTVPNDAFNGGGAGGTNDLDNDGRPDATLPGHTDEENDILDNIGDAMEDIADGIADGVGDVASGIGDAGDDLTDTTSNKEKTTRSLR